jgi:hypothetical protein
MSTTTTTLLSLGVIGALILCVGGGFMIRKGEGKRGALMIAVGLVVLANVAIASVPVSPAG